MNERRYYMAIGIFVLSGFSALLFLAFRISGGSSLYTRDPSYQITAEFTSIGRLKSQSKVAIAGVTIGRVADIQLNSETFEAIITLNILNQYNQLPEDSRFGIVTAGLLGDNYIICYPGFSSKFLQQGDHIDTSQTTSALVLEELISKILTAFSSGGSSSASQLVTSTSQPQEVPS